MYKYPYGNYSQLNLNWIINKIKDLEHSIGSNNADIEEVANALISASYSSVQEYAVNDIVYDPDTETLYRCNTAIPSGGEAWNTDHWDAILIGPTVANLVRAVAYMSSDEVFNHSTVTGLRVTQALNTLKTAVDNVADITGDGDLTDFTATDLTGAVNELKDSLNVTVMQATVQTITASTTGTSAWITLTGLTANHVVGNWGMFSDSACTTPIAENSPPCDITIESGTNQWRYTLTSNSTAFYLRPTFILKQN